MSELRQILEDIRRKLTNGVYQNEEHVRLSLVARIVQSLGWDIWNPGEVNAEYKATPQEDNTKVDLTLLTSPRSAAVFIEIKDVGKLIPKLSDTKIQMKGYLRNYSAPFCILCDGQQWLFYYVYADRIDFSDKCFKEVNINKDSIDELESVFYKYLAKENHLNGKSKTDAETEMALSDRERQIRECLSEAQNLIKSNPLLSPVQALIQVSMERYNIEITQSEAYKCFNESNTVENTVSLPISVTQSPHQAQTKNDKLRGGTTGFGKTKLNGFSFNGTYHSVNNWANLLPELSTVLAKQFADFERVLNLKGRTRPYYDINDKNMRKGKVINGTNIYVESHGDPNEIARRAHLLLRTFNIPTDILLFDAHKR
ncbi:type I restriction enzyme HsdR N-terminal domain-containing protein [bacterium]|nr:type I restriction enzyme HsdR N-terminal domain-containing protein [bacterium]